jgi:hypothetical protein
VTGSGDREQRLARPTYPDYLERGHLMNSMNVTSWPELMPIMAAGSVSAGKQRA